MIFFKFHLKIQKITEFENSNFQLKDQKNLNGHFKFELTVKFSKINTNGFLKFI